MQLKHPGRKALVSAALATLVIGVPAFTATAFMDGGGDDSTLFAESTLPTNAPQTPEQAELGKTQGRALPPREVLQPTLDPGLRSFRPAYGKKQLSGSIKCASSDVLPGLAKAWAAELHDYYPKVSVSIEPPYAGSLGALELIKGNLDCVFVSRELKPTDISGFNDAFGYAPFSVPISGGSYRQFGFLDSVGFVVNKANPLNKLSLDQLDRVLSTTNNRGGTPVRTWGDLGLTGEWADEPIHVVGIKPWNGFEEFVRERVMDAGGKRGEWRNETTPDDDVTFYSTVFDIAGDVARDKFALGYTGLAYVDEPVKVVSLSQHDNEPGIPASYENVALAKYPLSRLVYLNSNNDPSKPANPILTELTRLILSKQGQDIVHDQGIYMPLRTEQVAQSKALLTANP
jgi:phosphate transport system substrate-binding protein